MSFIVIKDLKMERIVSSQITFDLNRTEVIIERHFRALQLIVSARKILCIKDTFPGLMNIILLSFHALLILRKKINGAKKFLFDFQTITGLNMIKNIKTKSYTCVKR